MLKISVAVLIILHSLLGICDGELSKHNVKHVLKKASLPYKTQVTKALYELAKFRDAYKIMQEWGPLDSLPGNIIRKNRHMTMLNSRDRIPEELRLYILKILQFNPTVLDEYKKRHREYPKGHWESVKTTKPLNVSQKCWNDWTLMKNGFDLDNPGAITDWAFEMFDASGKIGPGILQGNLHFVGNFDQCNGIRANISQEKRTFNAKYCTGQEILELDIPLLDISLLLTFWHGECIPSECNAKDLNQLLKQELVPPEECDWDPLSVECIVQEVLYESISYDSYCRTPPDYDTDGYAQATIILVLILAIVVVLATFMEFCRITAYGKISAFRFKDIWNYNNGSYTNFPKDQMDNATTHLPTGLQPASGNYFQGKTGSLMPAYMIHGNGELKHRIPTANGTAHKDTSTVKEPTELNGYRQWKPLTNIERIVFTFSGISNFRKILNATHEEGSFSCLHGIKVLSMGWLIFAHTHLMGPLYAESWTTKNLLIALERLELYSFQPIINAGLTADTFFMITGLILSYSFLHFLKRKKGGWTVKKVISTSIYYIFHRWWRLTIVYAAILMVYINLQPYLSNGPIVPEQVTDRENCLTNWWKNILYINNIYKYRQGCMTYSWFLGCIMQFYWVTPFILIPLFYFPFVGGVILLLFLAGNLTALGVLNHRLESRNYTDSNQTYVLDFYYDIIMKPYTRIGPHLVGIFIGYILFKNQCQFPKVGFPKVLNVFGWAASIAMCSAIAYGTHSQFIEGAEPWSVQRAVAYETLCSLTWSLAIGWMCFSCITGYGGVADSILSWGAFLPLSRLTFVAHITHPLLLLSFIYNKRDTVYITDSNLEMWWLAHVGYSIGTSFLLAILVEWPFREVEKEIVQQIRMKRKPELNTCKKDEAMMDNIAYEHLELYDSHHYYQSKGGLHM
ncbi:unnamed protein product [Owenia fusiformis]|uniref:Nose resistant-to-fluoxetine protein N-terminal domain-containing protein n=1 Tax=Owenia fusiformis TaxID=6347 RepID=A0A8S4MUM6_OWEFU|nr:unnamed protein product [Owenia fusiformis]